MKDLVIMALAILTVWVLIYHAAEPNAVGIEQARVRTAEQQVQQLQARIAAMPTATPQTCMYYYQSSGYGCK